MTDLLCRCGNSIDPIVNDRFCPSCHSKWTLARGHRVIELRDRPWNPLARNLERHRRQGLPATITLDEWRSIYTRHQGRCAICHTNSAEVVSTLDAEAGMTKENTIPACAPCIS